MASDLPCLKTGHEAFMGKYDVIFWEGVVKKAFDVKRSPLCISSSHAHHAFGASRLQFCKAAEDGTDADGSEKRLIKEARRGFNDGCAGVSVRSGDNRKYAFM